MTVIIGHIQSHTYIQICIISLVIINEFSAILAAPYKRNHTTPQKRSEVIEKEIIKSP